VNFFNSLDGIQMIDTGIKTNLVHDSNTSILGTVRKREWLSYDMIKIASLRARLLPQLTLGHIPSWQGRHRTW
jgi:hypothetical protein